MNMTEPSTGNMQKIAREIEGAPVAAYGYRLRPVARVQGWWGAVPTAASTAGSSRIQATGGGAFVQITPIALYIEQADHAPTRITLVTDNQPQLRKMFMIGMTIAILSMLINLLIRLRYR